MELTGSDIIDNIFELCLSWVEANRSYGCSNLPRGDFAIFVIVKQEESFLQL